MQSMLVSYQGQANKCSGEQSREGEQMERIEQEVNGYCKQCDAEWNGKDADGDICTDCQQEPSCHTCGSYKIVKD